jgi:hypothetical protein
VSNAITRRKASSAARVGQGDDLDIERAAAGGQGESVLARRNGAVMLTQGREGDTQIASNPSESLGIVEPLSESLSGAQVVEDAGMFIEREQDIPQVKPHVDGLC